MGKIKHSAVNKCYINNSYVMFMNKSYQCVNVVISVLNVVIVISVSKLVFH